MQLMTNVLTCFHPHCEDCELVPGHFIISMKWFYNVGNVYFFIASELTFKRVKTHTLIIVCF